MVTGGDSKGFGVMGSNPNNVYWMDNFSHLFVVKIIMFI